METVELNNTIGQLWIYLLKFGQQLSMLSITRKLNEDEALAYRAICNFAEQKALADAEILKRSTNERTDTSERGSP